MARALHDRIRAPLPAAVGDLGVRRAEPHLPGGRPAFPRASAGTPVARREPEETPVTSELVPSPGSGPGASLSDFAGEAPSGNWRVCVADGDDTELGTLD